jgi:hypothetical protein
MYFLDPSSGRRRRAVVADKSAHLSRVVGRGVGIAARDIGNRAQGVVAKGKQVFRREDVADDVLVERVRSEMGRAISDPSEIHVESSDGYVTLSGPVLEREIRPLLKRIGKVSGVRAVVDRLSPELLASDTEGTSGRGRGHWAPAKRACAIATGLSALVFAATRRNSTSMILRTAGAALLARGVWNRRGRKLASVYAEEGSRQAS